jgi:hypothetical protein
MGVVTSIGGIRIFIPAGDHCPPHVHASHRGEGWEAKFEFSFLDGQVRLKQVLPAMLAPSKTTLDMAGGAIAANLGRCRNLWWRYYERTCLDNKWIRLLPKERIEVLPKKPSAGKTWRIAASDYGPATGRIRLSCESANGQVLGIDI